MIYNKRNIPFVLIRLVHILIQPQLTALEADKERDYGSTVVREARNCIFLKKILYKSQSPANYRYVAGFIFNSILKGNEHDLYLSQ